MKYNHSHFLFLNLKIYCIKYSTVSTGHQPSIWSLLTTWACALPRNLAWRQTSVFHMTIYTTHTKTRTCNSGWPQTRSKNSKPKETLTWARLTLTQQVLIWRGVFLASLQHFFQPAVFNVSTFLAQEPLPLFLQVLSECTPEFHLPLFPLPDPNRIKKLHITINQLINQEQWFWKIRLVNSTTYQSELIRLCVRKLRDKR